MSAHDLSRSWAGQGGLAAMQMILKRLLELAPDAMNEESYPPCRKMFIRLTGRLQVGERMPRSTHFLLT